MVYQEFCNNSQTVTKHGKKESEVGLDRETGEGISGAKEEVYKRTSVSSTRLRQKNENGS